MSEVRVQKVYFYPHAYLRERQLDVIRRWPRQAVLNPEILEGRHGGQVSPSDAKAGRIKLGLRSKLPIINLKRRPSGLPHDVAVYVWGGVMTTGQYIVDLDNPWSLVGYNLRAMPLYQHVLKRMLQAERCLEIRCMSKACRLSLKTLFGDAVYRKAKVYYPCQPQAVSEADLVLDDGCRFLFIATQFEIKGGEALFRAFSRLYTKHPSCSLTVITHLPDKFKGMASACDGIVVHGANFSRDEVHERFMRQADVLVLPTYVDSFGMVALEALAHGLALIVSNVYALPELVKDGVNGNLLVAPVSIWDGVMPSAMYHDLENAVQWIRNADTKAFENDLEKAMEKFAVDEEWRLKARRASLELFQERFAC